MTSKLLYKIVRLLMASVWLLNGLVCKVLNLVPRHQQIVASILGENHAAFFTKAIGISEIIMAAWIVSGHWRKENALMQLVIIGIMNLIEFILVPELLLWGRVNAMFAIILMITIWYNEFVLIEKKELNKF